jgi:hypothetical protein
LPWKGQNGGEAGASRRRRVWTLVLALMLAAVTAFLATGSAGADFWPHLATESPSGSGGGHDG